VSSQRNWEICRARQISHPERNYSFAIISRRSAMWCLMRAIFSGQPTWPWYGTPAAYSRSASASTSSACSSCCCSVGPGIKEGYHSSGFDQDSGPLPTQPTGTGSPTKASGPCCGCFREIKANCLTMRSQSKKQFHPEVHAGETSEKASTAKEE
jgi:hypothetical protein